MKYIANQDIGDFKKGDEVPAEQAMVWNEMFTQSPCDVVNDSPKKEVPVKKTVNKTVTKAPTKKSIFSKK